MKTAIKVLFVIFLVWMVIGFYLLNTQHEKAEIVMGLGVFFLSFILMPIFIYYRYKDGKYKKYIINDEKLRDAFNKVAKK
jgi:amino acid permease